MENADKLSLNQAGKRYRRSVGGPPVRGFLANQRQSLKEVLKSSKLFNYVDLINRLKPVTFT